MLKEQQRKEAIFRKLKTLAGSQPPHCLQREALVEALSAEEEEAVAVGCASPDPRRSQSCQGQGL